MYEKLTSLDLFSGYGGISLALQDYVRPIMYCEIEEYARAILLSRMDDKSLDFAPIWNDVTTIDGELFKGLVDIIYGGFPCQDISTAGKGAGLGGKRSGLFFEVIRLAKESQAPFVFLENVPAIRTRGLNEVVGAFTEIGHDCRWTCLSAASVGAPHKRERWFLLAYNNSLRVEGTRPELEATRPDELPWDNRSAPEPDLLRVAHGTPFRVDRIKSCGNGVVPLQVKTAFKILMGMR